MSYSTGYVAEAKRILDQLDVATVERIAQFLSELRQRGGRLFVIGVGGGAGHASHAVSDFRKVVGIEAYSPSDNVSELTARANDEGFDTVYAAWLAGSHLTSSDMVLVLSVGGGDPVRGISMPLIHAIDHARTVGACVVGIVGRDGGYTARFADASVIIPTVNPQNVTAHTESLQSLICHLLISHPLLRANEMKWESLR